MNPEVTNSSFSAVNVYKFLIIKNEVTTEFIFTKANFSNIRKIRGLWSSNRDKQWLSVIISAGSIQI